MSRAAVVATANVGRLLAAVSRKSYRAAVRVAVRRREHRRRCGCGEGTAHTTDIHGSDRRSPNPKRDACFAPAPPPNTFLVPIFTRGTFSHVEKYTSGSSQTFFVAPSPGEAASALLG